MAKKYLRIEQIESIHKTTLVECPANLTKSEVLAALDKAGGNRFGLPLLFDGDDDFIERREYESELFDDIDDTDIEVVSFVLSADGTVEGKGDK